MTNEVLRAIRTRRVVRRMTAEPIDRGQLITVLKAARWAPSGGNRRLHRFVAVQRPVTLRLLRMVSPGMIQHPTAAVVICIDWRRVAEYRIPPQNKVVEVDVGTALQTMLLAAHAVGLGAGPVMSFSKAAVRVILQLPSHLSPEVLVCLGHPAPDGPPPMRTRGRITWQSLTDWEDFPSTDASTTQGPACSHASGGKAGLGDAVEQGSLAPSV
jgi:nitroreductase